MYEGQWKGDKANGEGGDLQPLRSPQPSLLSIARCVSPCRWVEAHELPFGWVRESLG